MFITRGSKWVTWILALLIPAFFVGSILGHPVEQRASDAPIHINRAVLFSEARADGWLYPRWVPHLNGGLGSPIFSFYPPTIYYVLDLIHQLGPPYGEAWRILLILTVTIAAVGAFVLALALFRRADVALVCAVSYAYAPYLQQDLLERGSPEGLAIALVPWVLLGLLRLVEHPSGLSLALASLIWALLILTHNLTALIFLLVIAFFFFYLYTIYGTRALWIPVAVAVGILLTAFHVLPFFSELRYVQFSNATRAGWSQPADQPLALSELFRLPPIFDTGLGNNSMMNHRVNVLQFATLGLTILVLPWLGRKRRINTLVFLGGAVSLAGLMVWLQTGAASWLWRAVSSLKTLQFRWRFLSIVALPTSLALGFLICMVPPKRKGLLAGSLCAAFILVQLPSLYPELLPPVNFMPIGDNVQQVAQIALEYQPDLTALGEFIPRWREWPFTAEETKWVGLTPIANLPQGARLISDERRTAWIRARFESPVPFAASMHLLYYPGWVGYVDGVKQIPRPAPASGYATVDVAAGTHTIEFRYEGTLVQHVSEGISLSVALLLGVLACLWRARAPLALPAVDMLRPAWIIPVLLVACVAIKAWWIDPHTNLLRWASRPGAIVGAQVHTDARVGDTLRLCGYTLPRTQYGPGDTIAITFFWERLQPMADPRANSFVHLLGTEINPDKGHYLWGQYDMEDKPGVWETGKLYRRVCEFQILSNAPVGEYKLEVGWWRPSDGQLLRARMVTPGGHLTAAEAGFLLLSGLELH